MRTKIIVGRWITKPLRKYDYALLFGLMIAGYFCNVRTTSGIMGVRRTALDMVGLCVWVGALGYYIVIMKKTRMHPRRDKDDTLHCARCDYVIDPALASGPCPECGSEFTDSGSIARGNIVGAPWRRSWCLYWIGIVSFIVWIIYVFYDLF